jgi:hypothetical protein
MNTGEFAERRARRLPQMHRNEQDALDSLRNYPDEPLWGRAGCRFTVWVSCQYRRLMFGDRSPPGVA